MVQQIIKLQNEIYARLTIIMQIFNKLMSFLYPTFHAALLHKANLTLE